MEEPSVDSINVTVELKKPKLYIAHGSGFEMEQWQSFQPTPSSVTSPPLPLEEARAWANKYCNLKYGVRYERYEPVSTN